MEATQQFSSSDKSNMTTTKQYTYDYNQYGVKCRHSEDGGWEPIEPNCYNCGHKTEECSCGEYKEGWYAKEEGWYAKEEKKEKEEKPFHTKNIFPSSVFAANTNLYTSKFQTCCLNPTTQHGINRELWMGYVLKKGKKITQSQLDRLNEIDPEMKRFYVGTTILTLSQTTAYQSNQDNYEDITSRLDRQMLRYNFKDRIPKGKHIFAVLVPTRSNPNFKNCPNYDIPYKAPVMMRPTDRGAIWMPNGAAFAMNPLGDAIIVLKD
jgi:hypothetical protein